MIKFKPGKYYDYDNIHVMIYAKFIPAFRDSYTTEN